MRRNPWSQMARLGYACLLIGGATLHASEASEQPREVASRTEARPRIGLALAGGGARGGAHVGVLKVLEELRVPVDCIAGTSMGALVGGGYASGMSATEIEQFLSSVDWKSVVGGAGNRALQSAEQKRFDDATGSFELGLKKGRVVAESGLISTGRIEDVLRRFVAQARAVADFNQLPIPYRAVATDMLSGNMVVLSQGDIATAMRASMAIPGAFAPVVTDEFVLSDGFIVRNLPIDVARSTCADIVIAVNLVKNTTSRDALASPIALIWRSNDVMAEANERLQLATLTSRDVRVDVSLGDIEAADFERTAETIVMGERAARGAADRLAALSVSEAEYAAWRARVSIHPPVEATRIAAVRFEGLKRVNPAYLQALTQVHAGDAVDIAAISRDANRMAVLDDLSGVEYTLGSDPGNPELIWHPREKEIGPDYLRPSGGLYGGGAGDLQFELGLQHVRRWLNEYGGQWRNRLQIGSNSSLDTSLYQPLDVSQRFFVEPGARMKRTLEDVYNDGGRVARYYFTDIGGRIEVGANRSQHTQIRAAYWLDQRRVDVDTGISLMPTDDARDAGLAAGATYDTRDASSFATRGVAAQFQYFISDEALGGERNFQRMEAAARKAYPFGKRMMWLTAAAGSDLGSALPADRAFSLGGPQSFRGYSMGEIRARRYWTLDGAFLWNIADILPIASQSLYGGVSVQTGRVYDRVDPVPNDWIYGGATWLGGRTPLGPLTFGIGSAGGGWAGWITLGTPVGDGSILNQPMFR
jgi:NTE family protein